MRSFIALIQKEWLEMWRNYKWIMVPIVFMILGALQPISFYYMPDILKNAQLPEGTILQIPLPKPSEAMAGVYSQFNQLGIFILVLISMGAISNERKSGAAELLLVKPLTISEYFLSKWVSYTILTVVSTLLGSLMGWFYTVQLIGALEPKTFFFSVAVYLLYIVFIITMNLFFSSLFSSGIFAGGMTIITAIGMSVLTSLPLDLWWLPSHITQLTQAILQGEETSKLLPTLSMTGLYILLFMFGSIATLKRKEI